MSTFRYHTTGNWYKGNSHIHSTLSDGGKTFDELARMYADAGYHFLCRTDHWVASDVAADPAEYPLLWLDGIELDGADSQGSYYHIVCLGRIEGIDQSKDLQSALKTARAQGALIILAHPFWTGNTAEEALRWGFHGVEIYSHLCRWMNGKSNGLFHWDVMLRQSPDTVGLAVDDAHIRAEHPGWNGAWIVVNAPACTREAILTALRAGHFYSSCGPELHSIEFDGRRVSIRCSPVQFVRLAGPGARGARLGSFEEGTQLTEATFDVPQDWPYVYLEVEDSQHRRAWTNALFTV